MNGGPAVSIIGSIGLALAGAIVGWLATHGIVQASDVPTVTAAVGTVLVTLIGAGIVWFKAKTSTLDAKIAAINSDPSPIKVVSTTTGATVTTAPPVTGASK